MFFVQKTIKRPAPTYLTCDYHALPRPRGRSEIVIRREATGQCARSPVFARHNTEANLIWVCPAVVKLYEPGGREAGGGG